MAAGSPALPSFRQGQAFQPPCTPGLSLRPLAVISARACRWRFSFGIGACPWSCGFDTEALLSARDSILSPPPGAPLLQSPHSWEDSWEVSVFPGR